MVSTQSDNNQCSGGSSWRQPRIIIISDLDLRIDCLVHCQHIPISSSSDLHMRHNFEYSWKYLLLPCNQLPFPGYSFAKVCSTRKSTQMCCTASDGSAKPWDRKAVPLSSQGLSNQGCPSACSGFQVQATPWCSQNLASKCFSSQLSTWWSVIPLDSFTIQESLCLGLTPC